MTELNQVLSKQLEQNRTRRLTTEAREKLLKAALGMKRKKFIVRLNLPQVTTEAEVDIVLSEKKQLIRAMVFWNTSRKMKHLMPSVAWKN